MNELLLEGCSQGNLSEILIEVFGFNLCRHATSLASIWFSTPFICFLCVCRVKAESSSKNYSFRYQSVISPWFSLLLFFKPDIIHVANANAYKREEIRCAFAQSVR